MADPELLRNPRIDPVGRYRIRLVIQIQNRTPPEIFPGWTNPKRLVQWWPTEVRMAVREGGEYEYRWPR